MHFYLEFCLILRDKQFQALLCFHVTLILSFIIRLQEGCFFFMILQHCRFILIYNTFLKHLLSFLTLLFIKSTKQKQHNTKIVAVTYGKVSSVPKYTPFFCQESVKGSKV